MSTSTQADADGAGASPGRPGVRWWAGTMLLVMALLAGVAALVVRRAGPILKGRVTETLSARFNSRVELDALSVSLVRGLEVSGDGLRIFPPDDVVAAGAVHPLIAVRHFSFHAGLTGLFVKPMHVGLVRVAGMEIHVPPRQMREAQAPGPRRREKIKIEVARLVIEDSALTIDTSDAGKEPKRFVLQRIDMTGAGPGLGWNYDATLVNAVPKGEIHAAGRFGPWIAESPGDAPVSGHYTFDHADLNPIKGIGGMLSSVGDFTGRLNRIDVTGTADVPEFSLDTAKQPVPLHTRFHAVVDGTTGDTDLQPVEAQLRSSRFTCRGSVVNLRGVGHVIDLEVDVPDGLVQDFLALAVKTRPVVMTGRISTKAKLHLPPGKASVMQKLQMRASFGLRGVHFSNARWQEKVDELSLRAQGRPAEAKQGAPDVRSEMKGRFVLAGGRLDFSELEYEIPGATIALDGVYSLDGEQFDFHGNVRTQAKPSEMVQSWWKQILLKPVDHFLTKGDAGLVLPIAVSGTKSDPKVGVDFKRMEFFHKDDGSKAPAPPK